MISLQIDSHRSYQQRCRCLLQKHYKNLHQLPKSIRKTIHLAFSADYLMLTESCANITQNSVLLLDQLLVCCVP